MRFLFVLLASMFVVSNAHADSQPAEITQKIGLTGCLVVGHDYKDDFFRRKFLQVLSTEFDSVFERSALDDSNGCDLMLLLLNEDHMSGAVSVYFGHSKQLLLHVRPSRWGSPQKRSLLLGTKIRESFAPGTPLHDQVAAERQDPPRASPTASLRPQTPEKQAAPSIRSDVDEPSEKAKDRPDDFALIIGIEEYQSLPKADFGARDARTVRRHFEALGIPARNIITLEGQAATGNKIKSYVEEWLPLNVKENSTLFVYYSGHGAPDPKTGQAYLVPWDGDPQFLKSTAYPLKKLYSDLARTKAKHVIIALDACFSGAGGRSVLAKGARPLVTKVDQEIVSDGRITILAAASGDQITGTLEDQGHGMFTYFLLKGLGEGKKSAKELFNYLNPLVQDEARRQNREQTPALFGADSPL